MFENIRIIKRKKDLVPCQHFFIHLKWHQQTVSFGRYGMGINSFGPLNQYNDIQEFASQIASFLHKNGSILVYIHGFMAHVGFFEKKVGYILQNQVFNKVLEEYPVILSLKWESEPDYKEGIKAATDKGRLLFDTLCALNKELSNLNITMTWSWLCHSMGNRIFAHIFTQWLKHNIELRINRVFLMAADVPSDIFSKEFELLPHYAAKTYVFKSKSDHTLEIANWMVPNDRLGREGMALKNTFSNVFEIDVSGIQDHRGLAPRLLKHRYYYASETIRTTLLKLLKE